MSELRNQIIRDLYSCSLCKDALESYICLAKGKSTPVKPEVLLGSWSAKFVILGTNPGPYYSNETFEDYMKCNRQEVIPPDWDQIWTTKYLKVYNMFRYNCSEVPTSARGSLAEDFEKNIALLNAFKCPTTTEKNKKAPRNNMNEARDNCNAFLKRQLNYIQPKVILSHGILARDTTLKLLREGFFGSCNTVHLDKIERQFMKDVSKTHLILRRWSTDTLFLFSKHISRIDNKTLDNLKEHRLLVAKFMNWST